MFKRIFILTTVFLNLNSFLYGEINEMTLHQLSCSQSLKDSLEKLSFLLEQCHFSYKNNYKTPLMKNYDDLWDYFCKIAPEIEKTLSQKIDPIFFDILAYSILSLYFYGSCVQKNYKEKLRSNNYYQRLVHENSLLGEIFNILIMAAHEVYINKIDLDKEDAYNSLLVKLSSMLDNNLSIVQTVLQVCSFQKKWKGIIKKAEKKEKIQLQKDFDEEKIPSKTKTSKDLIQQQVSSMQPFQEFSTPILNPYEDFFQKTQSHKLSKNKKKNINTEEKKSFKPLSEVKEKKIALEDRKDFKQTFLALEEKNNGSLTEKVNDSINKSKDFEERLFQKDLKPYASSPETVLLTLCCLPCLYPNSFLSTQSKELRFHFSQQFMEK